MTRFTLLRPALLLAVLVTTFVAFAGAARQ